MEIFIATCNPHKKAEFAEMFERLGVSCVLRGADEAGGMPDCDESGETFAENAMIKADCLAKRVPPGAYVMADDSGICVDFLGGAPGVRSARYSGVVGSGADSANNEKLLKALQNVPDEKRGAHFSCSIALVCPDGRRKIFEGRIDGFIARRESGAGGFGYDPLFYVPELGMTTAEISQDEKNSVSHRGRAFEKLAEFLSGENSGGKIESTSKG